jgi:zinc protease
VLRRLEVAGFHDRQARGIDVALEGRRMARTQDRALVGRLGLYSFVKRTFAWDIEFESKIAALTPAEVNAAFKRHVDPARLSIVKAGDFKTP